MLWLLLVLLRLLSWAATSRAGEAQWAGWLIDWASEQLAAADSQADGSAQRGFSSFIHSTRFDHWRVALKSLNSSARVRSRVDGEKKSGEADAMMRMVRMAMPLEAC